MPVSETVPVPPVPVSFTARLPLLEPSERTPDSARLVLSATFILTVPLSPTPKPIVELVAPVSTVTLPVRTRLLPLSVKPLFWN